MFSFFTSVLSREFKQRMKNRTAFLFYLKRQTRKGSINRLDRLVGWNVIISRTLSGIQFAIWKYLLQMLTQFMHCIWLSQEYLYFLSLSSNTQVYVLRQCSDKENNSKNRYLSKSYGWS